MNISDLLLLRKVCLQAVELNDQGSPDFQLFRELINPELVLDFISILEKGHGPEGNRLPDCFDPVINLIAEKMYCYSASDQRMREQHYKFVKEGLRIDTEALAENLLTVLLDYFDILPKSTSLTMNR